MARAERRARYGSPTPADPRTWNTPHAVIAVIAALIVLALPTMLGDGSTTQGIWTVSVVGGLVAWLVWLRQLHARGRLQRQAGIDFRRHAAAQQADSARQAALAYAQSLLPRQVGRAWHHGACTTNHRTYDTAARCGKG